MVATRDEAGPRLTLGLPAHPVMPLLLGAFILGYLLVKLGCEPAPLLLGFVLGPLLEDNLRRAMIIARGDPTTFLDRPISLALLTFALLALVVACCQPSARSGRWSSPRTKSPNPEPVPTALAAGVAIGDDTGARDLHVAWTVVALAQ